jgi:hypothetical protein
MCLKEVLRPMFGNKGLGVPVTLKILYDEFYNVHSSFDIITTIKSRDEQNMQKECICTCLLETS